MQSGGNGMGMQKHRASGVSPNNPNNNQANVREKNKDGEAAEKSREERRQSQHFGSIGDLMEAARHAKGKRKSHG